MNSSVYQEPDSLSLSYTKNEQLFKLITYSILKPTHHCILFN